MGAVERVLNYYEINGRKKYVTPYAAKYMPGIVKVAKELGISELYLFGSATTLNFLFWCSDLDFAARASEETLSKLSRAIAKIQDYPIDMVNIDEVSSSIILNEINRGVKLI